MQIQGKKILLRSVVPSDADILYRWENDQDNWDVSDTTKPFTRKEIEDFIVNQKDIYLDKQLRLIVCTSEEQVGCIDLFEFDEPNRKAGIGILIAEEYRNKGYASEALSLLIKYSFETLHLNLLHCNITESNTTSTKLFQRHGFSITEMNKDKYTLQLNSFCHKGTKTLRSTKKGCS